MPAVAAVGVELSILIQTVVLMYMDMVVVSLAMDLAMVVAVMYTAIDSLDITVFYSRAYPAVDFLRI
jgi:hypothetical protein